MHVAAFIGELQHYKNFKPLYLSTGKWAISPISGHIYALKDGRYLSGK